ncbi:MAG: hypothetical protein JWP78_135 [Mucilaginibacter sp.]|nr:hypothetical protein [Mucilaginibacter sp.]
MQNQNKLWRSFFAIGLAAIAVQQLSYADFRPVILPAGYPVWLTHRLMWAWIVGIALMAASTVIISEIKARTVSLILGSLLLLFVLVFQIPGQLYGPNFRHLGVWTDAFKELTLSGGTFIIAGSLPGESNASALIKLLEKLIPVGKYFLAITMVVFGIDHFLYPGFVATLVPNWIPGHILWTYLSGAALIASGLGILLNIKRQLAAKLLGITIFLWLIILHIPRALADPHSGNGNELTSLFEALAFSGIAFMISGKPVKQAALRTRQAPAATE